MIKVRMVGDWSKASAILGASSKLTKAIDNAVAQEAHYARREIIKGITDQAPGGKRFEPLSALTLALRKAKGFRGSKIMMVTAGLRNSVTTHRSGKGKYFVGVLRTARSKDGKSMVNVASVHELGATFVIRVTPKMRRFLMMQLRKAGIATRSNSRGGEGGLSKGVIVVRIPARPFMQPVFDKINGDPYAQQKRFAQRISKDMGLTLGDPD